MKLSIVPIKFKMGHIHLQLTDIYIFTFVIGALLMLLNQTLYPTGIEIPEDRPVVWFQRLPILYKKVFVYLPSSMPVPVVGITKI